MVAISKDIRCKHPDILVIQETKREIMNDQIVKEI